MVGAALTKENKVLGSPLMVSTQRVEPTTSKTMVSKRVPVLAKSRSEEGAKTRVSQNLEHLLEDERTKMDFLFQVLNSLRVFHNVPFIGKP